MNISKHLAIWTILTVLAVGILSSYIFYRMQFVNEMAKLESLGATVGGIVEAGLDNYMMARDISILNDTLHKLEKMEAINRILLLNKEGTVKFSTDKDKVGVTLDRHGPKCGGCHENGKKGLYLREEKVFRWIQPIRNKEGCFGCHDPSVRINGLCIIDLSVAQWEKDVWKQALVGFAIFIPSLVIISFIMLFLSKVLIIARLSRITESLQKFRAGDYEVRIPVERNDEITALVKGFNEMTETVSERRKERALWESAVKRQIHFLQLMIDTIPMPVFFKDLNGKYQGCNKSFKTLLGLTGEEIIGKTVYDLCPKEFADKYTQMDIELFENPGVQVYEYSVIDHDGANHNFIFNKATYAAADGSVAGLIGVMLDITERNLAERTIRRDYDIQSAINEILQVSLENVPLEDILTKALELILSIKWISFESRGSIFLIDDDSNKLVMRAQKGLSSFIQKKCAIVELGRCICGRAAANQEIQFADGIDDCHEGHFEGMADHGHYCTPILFSGKTLGVITIYLETGHRRDDIEELFLRSMANALAGIIQRKRMESEREEMIYNLQVSMAKVSESKEMWQDTFDSIGDLIYVEDQNSSIIKANSAFAAHFGLAPREVIGKQSHEFFDTAGSQVPKGPNIQATKEYSAGTFEIQDKVTGKVFLVTAFPFHFDDAGQKGTIYIAKDITIERAKEMRLIMSERLASLGQMASGIAHEINNPLAAIAGCTEGLANRVDKDRYDSGLFRNYLAIISEEILRCKRITNSMLSFVRKTSYEKTEININDVLSRTIEIIGFQGRLRDVEVVRKFQDVLPVIYGSEGEMKQVFLSVITNALDAMDDKGQITITTEAGTNYVIIKISDNGSGMSAETIKMVFDPFFTTKSAKGGTGLGLSIAREIVISYNGSVDVISEEGKGTTLIISLPF